MITIEKFSKVLRQSVMSLGRVSLFLEQVSEDKKLIFTDAKSVFGSTRHLAFHVTHELEYGEDKTTVHDFQLLLASFANQYFQQWLSEQGIEGEYELRVRQPKTFPSNYGIYKGNMELFQCNVIEQYYGARTYPKSDEDQRNTFEQYVKSVQMEIEKVQSKIAFYEDIKAHPIKHLKWRVLLQRKKNWDNLNERIARSHDTIASMKNNMTKEQANLERTLSSCADYRASYPLILPFFTALGYREETKQDLLY